MARNTAVRRMFLRRVAGVAGNLLGLFALLCFAYLFAGLVGGAIPVGDRRAAPDGGVRIYVEDNGIHTGIVVPVAADGIDWRDLVRAGDIADPRYAAHGYLAFGWGDRAFYVGTPRWADLDLRTVARAALGSDDTVLHVEHIPEPRVGEHVRTILLSHGEYRRLAAFIRASFAIGRDGRDGRAASVHGYGPHDAFYAARGHYNAIDTCNEWTGRALRFAGLRMGAWTPFSDSVMAWL